MEKKDWEELVERLIRENILRSPSVIKAMRVVCRDAFLPENMGSYAAVDSPLPLGWGQTISAPHD